MKKRRSTPSVSCSQPNVSISQRTFIDSEHDRLAEQERFCLESRQSLINIALAGWAVIAAGFAAVVEMWSSSLTLWLFAAAFLLFAGVLINVLTFVRLQVNVQSLLCVRLRQRMIMHYLIRQNIAPPEYPLDSFEPCTTNIDGSPCNTYTTRTSIAFFSLAFSIALLVPVGISLAGLGLLTALDLTASTARVVLFMLIVLGAVPAGVGAFIGLWRYYGRTASSAKELVHGALRNAWPDTVEKGQ